jgi:hypothetical protein
MPSPAQTANAALSVVTGLVKLAGRIDKIMAEQASLRSDLALLQPAKFLPPLAVEMKRALARLVRESGGESPDPLDPNRATLEALLAQADPPEDQLLKWMLEYLPEEVKFTIDDPHGTLAAKLRKRREVWDLDDDDILRAASFLEAGQDHRQQSLPWQLGTTVVNVAAEIAIDSQSALIRDDQARPIVVAVLERFADPDFTQVASARALLRHVLRATLNAALDNADVLAADKVWLDAILQALADAREASQQGDDYVVGLVTGHGYNLLVAEFLEEGAARLSGDTAGEFHKMAAHVLTEAAGIVAETPDFERFFQDHWSDLMRAALQSLHHHGASLLKNESPLLRDTLLAVIRTLAESSDRDLLSSDTLIGAVDAAIEVVAADPKLLDDVDQPWLRDLLSSVAGVVSDQGIRDAFSRQGLESLMREALSVAATHPELLIQKPGLIKEIVGGVLGQLTKAPNLRFETLATTGVRAILEEMADNPDLIDSRYGQLVADLAGFLAEGARDGTLSLPQAQDLLVMVVEVIARNPTFFIETEEGGIARAVVTVVLETVKERGLSRSAVTEIVYGVLELIAVRGAGLLGDERVDDLTGRVKVALGVALDKAEQELGRRLDMVSLAPVVIGVAGAWARGDVPTLDPDDPRFAEVFATVAEEVLSRAA